MHIEVFIKRQIVWDLLQNAQEKRKTEIYGEIDDVRLGILWQLEIASWRVYGDSILFSFLLCMFKRFHNERLNNKIK